MNIICNAVDQAVAFDKAPQPNIKLTYVKFIYLVFVVYCLQFIVAVHVIKNEDVITIRYCKYSTTNQQICWSNT